MTTRIGPQMIATLDAVWSETFATKHQLAVFIGPNGSNAYGDRVVMRCFDRGLITFDAMHPRAVRNSRGVPIITQAGREALEAVYGPRIREHVTTR